jgi:hypothetical protein
MAELGSARRKNHFVYCCVIAGTCFKVTVLAWRKYATILWNSGGIMISKVKLGSDENMPHYCYIHNRFYMDCPGIEPGD